VRSGMSIMPQNLDVDMPDSTRIPPKGGAPTSTSSKGPACPQRISSAHAVRQQPHPGLWSNRRLPPPAVALDLMDRIYRPSAQSYRPPRNRLSTGQSTWGNHPHEALARAGASLTPSLRAASVIVISPASTLSTIRV